MKISVRSGDRVFAEMIALELEFHGHTVCDEGAELYIIDTDTVDEVREGAICFGRAAQDNSGDFLLRPFLMSELLALVEKKTKKDESVESTPEIRLERDGKITVGGETVSLSETEYALLALLLDMRGEVVSREEIQKKIFPDARDSNVCEVYIHYLREKIDRRLDANIIRTVRGKGYIIK